MIGENLTIESLDKKRNEINMLIDSVQECLIIKKRYIDTEVCSYKDSAEYEKLFSKLVLLENKLNKLSNDIKSELELMTLY